MYLKEHFFPAVLKSEDGRYLAEGSAKLSVEDRWVEFHSQFVPLLPLGAQAVICRLTGGQESHSFTGEVYLSAPTLLRIVNVGEELLAMVELEELQAIAVKAWVSPVLEHKRLLSHAAEKLLKFEADIFSISLTRLRFVSKEAFEVGERLLVSVSQPPLVLKRVVVEVTQQLLFGTDKTVYRCDIIDLPEDARAQLIQYLSKSIQATGGPGEP